MIRQPNWLLATVASINLAACGSDSSNSVSEKEESPKLSAATLGEQLILDKNEYLASEPYASSSAKKGKQQAQICRACHSLDAGGANMIGPALHGMFGRRVGEQSGFEYSPVMKNADFVWTPRALDAWLAQPGSFLPGNRMTFAGVLRKSDRDDLVTYLLDATTSIDEQ